MKKLCTSLACMALLASAAACSDANPLTAPDAPRFDGVGLKGGGGRADSITVTTTSAGGQHGNGQLAAPTTVTTADDGGGITTTERGAGLKGSGG